MRPIQRFLRKFFTDRRGNFAMIFALAAIPLVIAAGAAVDISRAYIVENRLKAALDAAALAVGGATGKTQAQLEEIAQAYFDANYPGEKLGVPGAVSVLQNGNTVTLAATAELPTSLMGIVGINTLDIGASSQVTRQGRKLELALVLDVTGSMASGGRMTALKDASEMLLDILETSGAVPGDIKVSIVPFDTEVNVGKSNKNASWLKWSYEALTTVWWWQTISTVNVSKNSWKGCVVDRDQNYDVQNTIPTSSDSTKYPGASGNCNIPEILALTDDWDDLRDKIDELDPNGNTNTTIGLAWGWNMLTQSHPLSLATAPADDLDKVIVFLTDGDNTENRWTYSGNSIDARTEAVCTNIKATGIKIYTIRTINGNATLLRNCATKPEMYFDVTQTSQLTEVFTSIAMALSNLRISQ
ncbi:TadE/TadG family type IV pilus assembly protein [Parvibaculum sp.]|jgi:Flp pilus assembly protein TadG|uniref:vWA domain-containing protein n=1 Tax=Parvibaculum sp. TaxID=2024848 RepID=UPI000C4D0647|nr:TadE/TadG family type IV pilus assembly protein [Parvibaculum sp.]MAU61603.1 pilus assembly protein TadG [Parvibaculum sp.]MAU62517.1 pilus assembly protein TadG [Parvibaculum sp.]MBO6666542.1 VWA domain-containing protein [Parvibaculum sp.]MBO6690863.1 VWA domain-containing protein [Parvibaculum sp.]MBO6713163.1 VWA domain-containing protein [Parvibaculum sp.]|tara:strand:+ start:4248 stop:5489 length:1242 start_codon:yes stop_codon:yes gene_type:complete